MLAKSLDIPLTHWRLSGTAATTGSHRMSSGVNRLVKDILTGMCPDVGIFIYNYSTEEGKEHRII